MIVKTGTVNQNI